MTKNTLRRLSAVLSTREECVVVQQEETFLKSSKQNTNTLSKASSEVSNAFKTLTKRAKTKLLRSERRKSAEMNEILATVEILTSEQLNPQEVEVDNSGSSSPVSLGGELIFEEKSENGRACDPIGIPKLDLLSLKIPTAISKPLPRSPRGSPHGLSPRSPRGANSPRALSPRSHREFGAHSPRGLSPRILSDRGSSMGGTNSAFKRVSLNE